MNQDVQRWQDDGWRAFNWIEHMYGQSKTAWDDAQAAFEDAGWTYQFGNGFGGAAYTTNLHEWPFVYLKAFVALPPGVDPDVAQATAGVFGFLFYDGKRAGPMCFTGSVRWSSADADCDHWLLYSALAGDERDSYFDRTPGAIRIAVPTKKGRAWKPGIEEIKWCEVPVGFIQTPERLREIVEAGRKIVNGDDAPARRLVEAAL